jgi:hypothetical protein
LGGTAIPSVNERLSSDDWRSYPQIPPKTHYPRGWGETEQEQVALRKAAVEVFSGQKPIRMTIDNPATKFK